MTSGRLQIHRDSLDEKSTDNKSQHSCSGFLHLPSATDLQSSISTVWLHMDFH